VPAGFSNIYLPHRILDHSRKHIVFLCEIGACPDPGLRVSYVSKWFKILNIILPIIDSGGTVVEDRGYFKKKLR
jgi:hypothetical protein